jgi:hypothetical protein
MFHFGGREEVQTVFNDPRVDLSSLVQLSAKPPAKVG